MYKIGDTVRLRSGSTVMTVVAINDNKLNLLYEHNGVFDMLENVDQRTMKLIRPYTEKDGDSVG